MSDGHSLMLVGFALLMLAAVWHVCVVRPLEGDAGMERDVDYRGEWNEVAERARGKLAGALDLPVGRVELDYGHGKLYVPLEGTLIPYTIEAVMRDNAPGLRSKAAQWVSDQRKQSLSVL